MLLVVAIQVVAGSKTVASDANPVVEVHMTLEVHTLMMGRLLKVRMETEEWSLVVHKLMVGQLWGVHRQHMGF